MAIPYSLPDSWLKYDRIRVSDYLTNAKAAVIALTSIPFQQSWAEELQKIQLKREVAGTSRIEGADFTEEELDQALTGSTDELTTRSQNQAAACVRTYRWISSLPEDQPVNRDLVIETHRKIVLGADDDHCLPGVLRDADDNVIFGTPRHRGVTGGQECKHAFESLCAALQSEFKQRDPIIQALAFHYHFAAMHPFQDGNGRTARALEALHLQRCGLKDALFIAMSNYYYDEKSAYLKAMAQVRENNYDLTEFLIFGLTGIERQCKRLSNTIQTNLKKVLFKDVMYSLFGRMKTERKRVIAKRQIEMLLILLEKDYSFDDLVKRCRPHYTGLKNPVRALFRDFNYLAILDALDFEEIDNQQYRVFINLDWATEITETEFFRIAQQRPQAKTGIPNIG